MKTKTMKTEVEVNVNAIKDARHQIENQLGIINSCVRAVEKFTNKKELVTLAEIEKNIFDRTGFENYSAAADLLGLKHSFLFLQANLEKIDLTNVEVNAEGLYDVKPEYFAKVHQDNTTYLSEDKEQMLSKLQDLCNIINEIGMEYYNTIQISFDGKASVNVGRLHIIGQRGI